MSNSESNKTDENTTPKDSETPETPEQKKILQKAGIPEMQIVPVTKEENKKEEQKAEDRQEEITAPGTTEQILEPKTSEEVEPKSELEKEEDKAELGKQTQDNERYLEDHIIKQPLEPRSFEKKQYSVNESWKAGCEFDYWLESEAKFQNITKGELQYKAMLFYRYNARSQKQFIRDTNWINRTSACDTKCAKCKKEIPKYTDIAIFRSTGEVLCPSCWVERIDDEECIKLRTRRRALEKDISIFEKYLNKLMDQVSEYADKERVHKVSLGLESLWKLVEPANVFFKQLSTNQKDVPLKFVEYVNGKVESGKGGRPHFLSLIAKKNKDPEGELLKICKLAWIQNKSITLIAKDYDIDPKTIERMLKDLEELEPMMKEKIVEFIQRIVPELSFIGPRFIQDLYKFRDEIIPTAEEQIQVNELLEAKTKRLAAQEKLQRKKWLEKKQSEEEQGD